MAKIVRIETQRPAETEDLSGRVRRMASLLAAIDAGDLLAVPPECPAARASYEIALDLLEMLRTEMDSLASDLDGGMGGV
jgi:hypothetical protein